MCFKCPNDLIMPSKNITFSVFVPGEDRVFRWDGHSIRENEAVFAGPLEDGVAQGKIGSEFNVSKSHASHWAGLVSLSEPALDAAAVIGMSCG